MREKEIKRDKKREKAIERDRKERGRKTARVVYDMHRRRPNFECTKSMVTGSIVMSEMNFICYL